MSIIMNTNWNQFEAAILVDAYWRVRDGKLSKHDAAVEVSNRIRQAMLKQGLAIDPTFRNVNGISMQLSSVEYVLTDGLHGLHNPGKVITDVANMSLDKPEEYESILAQANQMFPLVPIVDNSGTPLLFSIPTTKEEGEKKIEIDPRLQDVLSKKFPKGFRLSSPIDKKRLENFYASMVGEPLCDISNEELSAYGVVYKNMLYMPDRLLDETSRLELMTYISQSFESGHTFIYYSVLFEHFSQMFSEQMIYDEQMLRLYLKSYGDSGWFYQNDMITVMPDASTNTDEKVETYVKEFGTIISFSELTSALSYIPGEVVLRAVRQSDKLLSGGRELCFHIDNFDISNTDIFNIEKALRKTIDSLGYATMSDLERILKAIAPSVWDNNISFGELSIRNALSYILQDKFSFVRNLISDKDHPMDSNRAIESFCKSNESVTLEEIKSFCSDCGTVLRYDIIYQYYLRIDHDTFVHRDSVQFDVKAVDEAIEKFVPNSYASFEDILVMSSLPMGQYVWNTYLLESYLAQCSAKFSLVHERYNQDSVAGAIVKKSSHLEDYNDVITLILAESKVNLLDKSAALELLVKKQYIAFRSFKPIDKILVKAQELRNKLKTQ